MPFQRDSENKEQCSLTVDPPSRFSPEAEVYLAARVVRRTCAPFSHGSDGAAGESGGFEAVAEGNRNVADTGHCGGSPPSLERKRKCAYASADY